MSPICSPYLVLYAAAIPGSETEALVVRTRRFLIDPYLPNENTYPMLRALSENTSNFPWQFGNCSDGEDMARLDRVRAASARGDLAAIQAETRFFHTKAKPHANACEVTP